MPTHKYLCTGWPRCVSHRSGRAWPNIDPSAVTPARQGAPSKTMPHASFVHETTPRVSMVSRCALRQPRSGISPAPCRHTCLVPMPTAAPAGCSSLRMAVLEACVYIHLKEIIESIGSGNSRPSVAHSLAAAAAADGASPAVQAFATLGCQGLWQQNIERDIHRPGIQVGIHSRCVLNPTHGPVTSARLRLRRNSTSRVGVDDVPSNLNLIQT